MQSRLHYFANSNTQVLQAMRINFVMRSYQIVNTEHKILQSALEMLEALCVHLNRSHIAEYEFVFRCHYLYKTKPFRIWDFIEFSPSSADV